MAGDRVSFEKLSEYDGLLRSDTNILKRDTTYALDSIVNKGQVYLKCTQAGKTDTATLVLTGVSVDDILDDGTAKWKVLSVNGIPKSSEAQMKEWESNTSYTVGENLVYGGTVYKVTTDFTSGEAFDDTNLEEYIAQKMKGATNSQDGESGLVPQPTQNDISKFLCGDGTWKSIGGSGGANVVVDTLWSGQAYTVGDTLTLTHDYLDYDRIILTLGDSVELVAANSILDPSKELGAHVGLYRQGNSLGRYAEVHFGSSVGVSSTTATMVVVNNLSSNWCLTKIEGIKFLPNPNTYSTTEQEIGTWIDGKKLYQIVITGYTPNINTEAVVGTIPGNVESVESMVGMAYTIGGPMPILWSVPATNHNDFLYMYIDTNNNIRMKTPRVSYQNIKFNLTIKYTKTTD